MKENSAIQLPTSKVVFRFGDSGPAVEVVGLVDLLHQLDSIREELRQTPDATRYTYLDRVKGLVKEMGGPDLTYDEADAFDDQAYLEYAKKKQARRTAFESTQK